MNFVHSLRYMYRANVTFNDVIGKPKVLCGHVLTRECLPNNNFEQVFHLTVCYK